MFKYLGLILVIFSWLAGGYLIIKWRDKTLPTISRHAASSKHASLFFAVVLIIGGLLFYLWLLKWFMPHLDLGVAFGTILTVAVACQIVTALAPDTTGKSKLIHHYAAYSMALLYLPLTALIIIAPHISDGAQIICSIAGLYLVATFITIVLLGQAKDKYLLFQALYVMAFQSLILVAAYW